MIQHISSHDQIIYKDAVGFALTNSNIYLTHADVKTKKSTEQSGTTFNQLTQLTTGSIYECAFSHQNFQHTANGTRLQYSCLENPMDGGAWQAAVHWIARSRTRLHFHFSLSCIEGNGNPLQYSCLENPMDGRAGWAAVSGVADSDMNEATQQQQQ